MKVEVLVYTCSFRCGWETKDISSLSRHLRHRHLQATVGVHIVCTQLQCCASFTRLDNFLQHLKSFHPINNRNYDGDHYNESAATCAAMDFPDEFQDFDTLQVVEQLRKSMLELFPPGVEDQIIKEQINGVTLLELNEPELKELGFVTMGQRKLVLRLVKAYNSRNNKVVYQSKVTPVPPQQHAFSNLAERIRETEGGKDILNQMRTDRYLNHSNRKMFIKICTEILIEEGVKAGYKRNYPPMEMKINLASSIVTVFPNLRSN
uniref:C2H2-type domain-containing protein n=1 Tax=Ciona savignyi TaxID=51511 RepID=H2ZGD1_CIOSA